RLIRAADVPAFRRIRCSSSCIGYTLHWRYRVSWWCAPMSSKLHYRQQRAERDRQVRAKHAEKLKKLQEKSQQRKAEHFDYAAAAELFLAKRSGGTRAGGLGHRRFSSAAEAIRFAIEGLPASRLLGVFMQVGDARFDAEGIRLLYQHQDYPLERSET